MTLPETLIAAGVLALALMVAALAIASIRTELKQRRTHELLVLLDAALDAYHHASGAWPEPERSAEPASRNDARLEEDTPTAAVPLAMTARTPTDPAEPLTAMLANVPAAREVLEKIPPELRVTLEEMSAGRPVSISATLSPWGTVQDAWGRPLHCLTANSPSTVDRQAVAANGGKPIFVSAGANGEFQNRERSEAADNLRSDELPR